MTIENSGAEDAPMEEFVQHSEAEEVEEGSLGALAGAFAVDVAKDVVGDFVFNILLWAGIILALALPIGGLAVGGLFLWMSINNDRSKFLPILTIAMSVIVWMITGSATGLLGALME